MTTPTDISSRLTHDLWTDGRQFTIDISRPTATTIQLKIGYPAALAVTDGAVVLLSEKEISATSYPQDGTQYTPSTDWLAPESLLGTAHVVGAYYGILNTPLPVNELSSSTTVTGYSTTIESFTITVTNTNPNTIYYASVHSASNVLQYYPIGVTSYPLDGEQKTGGPVTYTGNIPTFQSAPTSPTAGMVYYDQQLNLVQYYDGNTQAWIPTRADSIISGSYNPGILGQVYLFGGSQLKVFNGKKWVDGTPLNMQVRVPNSQTPFIPLTSMTALISSPAAPITGQMYYDYGIQRLQYWDGVTWMYPNSTNTLFNTGTVVVPAFVTPVTVEPEKLNDPYIGQLFYNTTTRELNAWNGLEWNKVNTDQEGETTQTKVAIGDDGSYAERAALIKILNSQLGWPQMCVELTEDQFNIAIDNALQNYRQMSSGAYRRAFVLFKLIPGQQKYYLNSAIDQTDSIVDVHKINRMGPLGIYGGGPSDTWAQAFAQQYYDFAAGGGDTVSTHLVAAYSEDISRLFAGELMFQWYEARRELIILRSVRGYETVVIEAMLERSEQELLSDRWCQQYLQNWALAELKMMLGMIRSKFSSGTPGPAGTITLNGELLVSEARQDMTELSEQLANYEFGGLIGLGNVSFLFS